MGKSALTRPLLQHRVCKLLDSIQSLLEFLQRSDVRDTNMPLPSFPKVGTRKYCHTCLVKGTFGEGPTVESRAVDVWKYVEGTRGRSTCDAGHGIQPLHDVIPSILVVGNQFTDERVVTAYRYYPRCLCEICSASNGMDHDKVYFVTQGFWHHTPPEPPSSHAICLRCPVKHDTSIQHADRRSCFQIRRCDAHVIHQLCVDFVREHPHPWPPLHESCQRRELVHCLHCTRGVAGRIDKDDSGLVRDGSFQRIHVVCSACCIQTHLYWFSSDHVGHIRVRRKSWIWPDDLIAGLHQRKCGEEESGLTPRTDNNHVCRDVHAS
eukprot:m.93310 g.93310  ORF g.93310 m.93310 type:complete len:321 (+) comp16532_c0_seq2:3380-4342(+)